MRPLKKIMSLILVFSLFLASFLPASEISAVEGSTTAVITENAGETTIGNLLTIKGVNNGEQLKLSFGYKDMAYDLTGAQFNIKLKPELSNGNFTISANNPKLNAGDVQINSVSDSLGVYQVVIGGTRLSNAGAGKSGELGTLTFDLNSSSDIEITFDTLVLNQLNIFNPRPLAEKNINITFPVNNTEPVDTTPPNEITNLATSNITATSMDLTWTGSTSEDVASYEVSRGTTILGTVTGTSYNVTGLTANIDYTFVVKAIDIVGNKSNGVTVSGKTLGSTGPGGVIEVTKEVGEYFTIRGTNDGQKIRMTFLYHNIPKGLTGAQLDIGLSTNLQNGNFTLSPNNTFFVADDLKLNTESPSLGLYQIMISRTAPAGNSGELGTMTFDLSQNTEVNINFSKIVLNQADILNMRILNASDVNVLFPKPVVVPDTTPPATPTVNPVTDQDSVVKGNAEPGSTVKVVVKGTTTSWSGVTDTAGNFSIQIEKQAAGTELEVFAVDVANNVGPYTIVIVSSSSSSNLITIPDNHFIYDVNRDGEVNDSDVNMVQLYYLDLYGIREMFPALYTQGNIVDLTQLTDSTFIYDVNRDGEVNDTDVNMVQLYYLDLYGIRETYPAFYINNN